MFVATSLARGAFNYARGTSSQAQSGSNEATPSNTRVKRRPKRPTQGPAPPSPSDPSASAGTSPPPSYDEVQAQQERSAAEKAKLAVIDSIIAEQDLYKVLGIKRNAKADEVRRAFLNRSRVCHPDKFPNYPASTIAFQKVSLAYETLSKPSSRRMYDVSGRTDFASALNNPSGSSAFAAATGGGFYGSGGGAGAPSSDETLNSVLYSVFCEFMEGDFEMIRVLVNALNEGNPGLNLGNDAVDSLEGAFRRLRKLLLAGKKYLTIIRFELIRMYEIQHSLRQLSYFDVFGRLRLTLQLARVTLSIPMAIDQAMKEPSDDSEDDDYEGEGNEADGDDASGATDKSNSRRRKRSAGENWSESESESEESDESDNIYAARRTQSNARAGGNDFGVVPSSDPEDHLDNEEAAEAEARRIRRQARMRAKAERERRRRARRANLEAGDGSAAGAQASGQRSQRNSRVFEKDAEAMREGEQAEGKSPKLFPTSGQRTPTPSSPLMDSGGEQGSGRFATSPANANASARSKFDTSPRDGTKVSGSKSSMPYSTPLRNSFHQSPIGQSFDDLASPRDGAGSGNPGSSPAAGLRPPFTHRRSRTTSTPTGFSPAAAHSTPSPNRRATLHPDDPIRAHTYGRAHGRTMSNAVPLSSSSSASSFHSPSGSSTFSSASFRRHANFGVHDEEDEEEVMGEGEQGNGDDMRRRPNSAFRRSGSGSQSFTGSPIPSSSSSSTSSRSAANAAAAAARNREREREREKKGLLGPTAAGLLKGVVKVLETSEAWVPGAAAAAKREAEET
ncbi:hypothetical protein OC834_003403 [Tilletia horrida]|nr:hypothetical protein OC834_003403 [Tilletia horrida]